MIGLGDLLKELGYIDSPNYHQTEQPLHVETAHLIRTAHDAGVEGVYVFATSSKEKWLPPRPIVYMAKADTPEQARSIHRNVWNLGYAPFLIILLPQQLRLYTGFNYDEQLATDGEAGLLDQADNLQRLVTLVSDFKASSIDSGLIWKSRYYKNLDQDQRVDKRLLKNLERLGETLENHGVPKETSHALIGKYVYLSYLRSRGILTPEWMIDNNIAPSSIFSLNASVQSLQNLVTALEEKLNGKIFPIDFAQLRDSHISWVASVFDGSEVMASAPLPVHQLCLPFKAYDFRYIPIETLSSIYEQFIRDHEEKGAIYTPEILADYLLSQLESVRPLARGMKVLDPACGSGVFLVLAYRRLIEKELQRSGQAKLSPELLRKILTESIFGIERERDACYVAEFSLILTLLHYADLSKELESSGFRFPVLHNIQILEADFFDTSGQSRVQSLQKSHRFDWVVGNPPWTELKPLSDRDLTDREQCARAWINNPTNRKEFPVAGMRVAEAFSWRVMEFLCSNGLAGLVLPATSLFNSESEEYRRQFFTKNEVLKVTNFANLREVLFGRERSGVLPAMTAIYRASTSSGKSDILHYAPFLINQVFPTKNATNKPWVLTVNETEIKMLPASDVSSGLMTPWKLALWGRCRDKRTLEIIKHIFPTSLEGFCERRGWGSGIPRQGPELRKTRENPRWPKMELPNARVFNAKVFNAIEPRPRMSLGCPEVLEKIVGERFIRWGEETLYATTPAPHLILSKAWQNFAVYSEEDFVVPPQQLVIPAPRSDADCLRALSVYLSSSLAAYYLFFHVPEWGVFRQRKSVITTEVRKIPTPEFTSDQITELANLHRELLARENQTRRFLPKRFSKIPEDTTDGGEGKVWVEQVDSDAMIRLNGFENELQRTIDQKIYSLLKIPDHVRLIVDEFVSIRLPLDRPSERDSVTRQPTPEQYLYYAQQLQNELDSFVMDKTRHHIEITYSDELVECAIEMVGQNAFIPVNSSNVKVGNPRIEELLKELRGTLREEVGDWLHIQRGLRLYDGSKIYIYKIPRLIDWTRTQAIDDATDIIGDMVGNR